MAETITKAEREVQNHIVRLVQQVHEQYQYAGNLEKQENKNIREEVLKQFLTKRQGLMDLQADETVRKLKDAAYCGTASELYNANKETYKLLTSRTQVKGKESGRLSTQTQFIDWEHPERNIFEIAEEVTVKRNIEDARHRRPDIVVYVNGIALVVLELKRDDVSVSDAIRQNIRNQEDGEIAPFFSTVQLVMAGNNSEGLMYGVIQTPEKFYLKWKEPCGEPCPASRYNEHDYPSLLDRSVLQMLEPARLLEFVRDCIVFDAGVKKAARPNQYFALKAAQERVLDKEKYGRNGGIIWHSQGSGKTLTMVWLAQWIIEHAGNEPRVVIITDRTELDDQMSDQFLDVDEVPYHAKSGRELLDALNNSKHRLICTLIHKFGGGKSEYEAVSVGDKKSKRQMDEFLDDVRKSLPTGYKPKGNIFVFVDECHRTQGGLLHEAMRLCLGDNYMMIGFTGTPLLHEDKRTTLEQFGPWIHTYKFDEAVSDGVIRDLRYESRNIDQDLASAAEIDQLFTKKTEKLTPKAKDELMNRWATFQKLFSSRERTQRIVADICKDFTVIDYLEKGFGNAMLVAGDIYQAYRYWKEFQSTELAGHCAVVTSYEPMEVALSDGHSGGGNQTEEEYKYKTAKEMMGEKSADDYEKWAKKEFIDNYKSMKLLIVVDKLLTGFDAPHATYLYIDKEMRDHTLFQAICRVNRNAEGKDYGYIIDYKDLFNNISKAVEDYTNGEGAFGGYDSKDVEGLLKNRLTQAKQDLDEAIGLINEICEPVEHPRNINDFYHYFVYDERTVSEKEQMAVAISKMSLREQFYNACRSLTRKYLAIATEMEEAGYTSTEADEIDRMTKDYDRTMTAIMRRSGDLTDLAQYDSEMRALLDRYVTAKPSELLAKLDDISFLDFITKKPTDEMVDDLMNSEDELGGQPGSAETITSNVRRVINRKHDQNPEEYDKLSERLNRLLKEMREGTKEYKTVLRELIELVKQMNEGANNYPASIDTPGKRALYDNIGKDEVLVQKIYDTVKAKAQVNWRTVDLRRRLLKREVKQVLPEGVDIDFVMSIIAANGEF
jgi:type I restriction enzyme, R subunit